MEISKKQLTRVITEVLATHGGVGRNIYDPTSDNIDLAKNKARNLGPGLYFSTGESSKDTAMGHARAKSNQVGSGTWYTAELPDDDGNNYISWDDPNRPGNIRASKVLYKFLYKRLYSIMYNDMLRLYKTAPFKIDDETIRNASSKNAMAELQKTVQYANSGRHKGVDLVTYLLSQDYKLGTIQTQNRWNSHNDSIRPFQMKENEVVCTSNEIANILRSMGFVGYFSDNYCKAYGRCHVMIRPNKDINWKTSQTHTEDNGWGDIENF